MLSNTPVELNSINNRNTIVKGDEVMGDGEKLTPLGKMAGIDA